MPVYRFTILQAFLAGQRLHFSLYLFLDPEALLSILSSSDCDVVAWEHLNQKLSQSLIATGTLLRLIYGFISQIPFNVLLYKLTK